MWAADAWRPHSSDTGLQLVTSSQQGHKGCHLLTAQETQSKADGPVHTDTCTELTKVAEAAIEPWVTEAGPVEAVAPAPVGTVAFLTTMFAIEALGAACEEQFSENWRAVGPPTHGSQRRDTPDLVPRTGDQSSHAQWAQAEPPDKAGWLGWPVPQSQKRQGKRLCTLMSARLRGTKALLTSDPHRMLRPTLHPRGKVASSHLVRATPKPGRPQG